MTSAALIVVVVAGSFAFADIVLIKALGLGVAIAVALDATVVRALLVPATMRLLGRWNWWMPASLERFVQSIAGLGGRDGSGGGAVRHVAALALIASLIGACTRASGPILANPPAPRPSIPVATEPPLPAAHPIPVILPRDDGPHDRLTEWWYYTGHLTVRDRGYQLDPERYGFEFVIFRAERGAFPTPTSHLALTDEKGDRFHYAQRLEVGDGVDRSPRDDDGIRAGSTWH